MARKTNYDLTLSDLYLVFEYHLIFFYNLKVERWQVWNTWNIIAVVRHSTLRLVFQTFQFHKLLPLHIKVNLGLEIP